MLFSRLIVRRIRLGSGLFLLLFVACHLCNLALGLVSVDAMGRWRGALLMPWQTGFGQALLLAAAIIHAGLGLAGVTPFAGNEPDGLGPAAAGARDAASARQSCRRASGGERPRDWVQCRLWVRPRRLLAIRSALRAPAASGGRHRLGSRCYRSLFDTGVETRLTAAGANRDPDTLRDSDPCAFGIRARR